MKAMSDHGPIQLKRTRESQGHSKKCKMQKGLTFPGTKCISLVLIIKLICFCQKKKKKILKLLELIWKPKIGQIILQILF